MGLSGTPLFVGHHKPLSSRIKKLAAASVLFAASALFAWSTFPGSTTAAGDTRTLSLYHVHTKESLTITYKKDGRYVPSALDKINYLLRDWRRNEVIKIDPKTVDLMWELHADLGSKAPIHIICGYRSANTNAMLKRIGRNVAKQSMHIRGKAIDLYFPDVGISKLRGSAMARQIGGVGYYPRSGASGFVHIDSGSVRYWPRPSEAQVAQIMQTYKKTIGARMTNGYMLAQAETGTSAKIQKANGKVQMAAADFVDDEQAEGAAPAAVRKVEGISTDYPVPKPRAKPIEVLMLAAAKMQIEPASAPAPKNNFARKPSPAADSIGQLAAIEDPFESDYSFSNISSKGSFAAHATHEQSDLVTASTSSVGTGADDFFWWPTRWLFNTDSIVRTDNTAKPLEISYSGETIEPVDAPEDVPSSALSQLLSALHLGGGSASGDSSGQVQSSGKSDSLFINRENKGDFAPAQLGDASGLVGTTSTIQ
jgi:uncharacterized protein YcbK (DUF882 family)